MSGQSEWLFRIQDMIDAINELDENLKNISEEDFYKNTFIQKATERYFEIIGEAARFVPKDIQNRYGNIEWSNIIGMRHKISHDYIDVDHLVLWKSYKEDFKILLPQLEQLLAKENSKYEQL